MIWCFLREVWKVRKGYPLEMFLTWVVKMPALGRLAWPVVSVFFRGYKEVTLWVRWYPRNIDHIFFFFSDIIFWLILWEFYIKLPNHTHFPVLPCLPPPLWPLQKLKKLKSRKISNNKKAQYLYSHWRSIIIEHITLLNHWIIVSIWRRLTCPRPQIKKQFLGDWTSSIYFSLLG